MVHALEIRKKFMIFSERLDFDYYYIIEDLPTPKEKNS